MWLVARPYVVVLLLTSAIVSRWFVSGAFIATGDMGPFIRRGWEPEASWGWNHSTTGAGSAAYNVARGFEFVLIRAVGLVGGDEYVAQWLFYTLIYSFVALAVAYFARSFLRTDLGVVVAGMFAVLNGFFLTRLPNPLNIISVASLALIAGLAIRVAMGRPISAPWAGLALLPTSFLGFNPPMILVAYTWALVVVPLLILLMLGRRAFLRTALWYLKAMPWALAINAWWLLPLASSFTGGGGATANADFSDPTNWAWSQAQNQVPNILTLVANWAWVKPQYLPFAAGLDEPWIIWVRYLIPALVLVGVVLAPRRLRRVVLVLLGVSLVVVFLAKGLQPPFSGVNLWLYNKVPGFWLFREPMSKLGQVLVLFFALFIGLAVESAVARARERRTTGSRLLAAAIGTAAVAVMLYPHPLWTGGVIPDARPQQPSAHVRVPDYWWSMGTRLSQDTRPGKVLVLPLDDYYQMPTVWGFFGVDSIANLVSSKPIVAPKPDGYFGDVPGFASNVRAVETALLAGDLKAVPRLLESIQVSQVVVRHDLIRGISGRSFADDRVLSAAVARTPGLTREVDGPLELFRLGDGSLPTVRTYDRVLAAPWQPAAGTGAIGSMTTDQAVLEATTPKGAVADATDPAPFESDDVTYWQVPPADEGAVSTTVTVKGGTYTLAQRARAGAVLVPRIDAAAGEVVLDDPTRVSVDGRQVSARPPLRVPVTRPDVIAVRVGTRAVSLDGFGRGRLPSTTAGGTTSASVVVGSDTPFVAWAPSTTPARVTPASDVYDCNNYEPRPAAELGLRLDRLDTAAGRVLRLSAKDHAACTRIVVPGAAPGRTYRVRMQVRSVTGQRPEVCLWQVGLDGCTIAPRLARTTGWNDYEQFVTLDGRTTGLQVIMYANVGTRLLPPTVTEYRDVSIVALDPVAETTVFPEAVPEVSVPLTAGTHRIDVTGGPAGSVLAPFGPLEDCFNYDDAGFEEAGLSATALGEFPAPSFRLTAKDHRACVAAIAPDMGAASLYELSYEARSVNLRNPQVCVYLRGPDRCVKTPTLSKWVGWTPYRTLVQPDPAAVETRVYLYGLRDLAGQQEAVVEYRDVKLRALATPSALVLVRQGSTTAPATVTWSKQNPATYPVAVTSPEPTALGLAETYAPGWSFAAGDGAPHVVLQGWLNGWQLPAGEHQGSIVYNPALLARKLLLVFPVVLVVSLAWIVFWAWRRRRREGAA